MATKNAEAYAAVSKTYEWGFTSDIEQDFAPKGLSEDTVRYISAKKDEPEWMLDWRLKAFRLWQTLEAPDWAKLNVPPIDYQDAYYYAEPKAKPKLGSLDEVDPEILRDARATRLAEVTRRLDQGDPEARWTARMTEEGGFHFERLWRGVTDHHIVEAAFVGSAEARKLHSLAAEQADLYVGARKLVSVKGANPADEVVEAPEDAEPTDENGEETLVIGKGETLVARPSQLLEAILVAGRKGLAIQRYKGLGEMNAEQLWETTLDPNNRSMLRVTATMGGEEGEIFSRLMGDVVEPRREFIQDNALNVANLDV